MGIKWGWHAATELTDEGLEETQLANIKSCILSCAGVVDFHLLRSRKMASDALLDVHVMVSPWISVSEGHYIAELVRFTLMKQFKFLQDVTVHIDIFEDMEAPPPYLKASTRPELEAQYLDTWSAILAPNANIKSVLIHYLQHHIDFELIVTSKQIPDANTHKTFIHQLQQTIEDDGRIGNIQIQYSLS